MIVSSTFARAAQSKEPPPFRRRVAGSSPTGWTGKEDGMQRLISLFREPEELPGLSHRPPPADDDKPVEEMDQPDQPLYFVQLLEYLRQQRQPIDDAVIGAKGN